MRHTRHFVLLATCLSMTFIVGAQTNNDISTIFRQFESPNTTDATAAQIFEVTSKDTTARDYVIQRLPDLISGAEPVPVWLNAVELAGKLKARETVPALVQALSRKARSRELIHTFAGAMHLDDDSVGRSLAEIGDPSVPEVVKLLSNPDPTVRKRAAIILINVKTPLARQALTDHLTKETDQHVHKLIESELGLIR